jgi:hypothetical protein
VDLLRINTLRIDTLCINTGVDDIVVSSRAMHNATDSHSMPIPEPSARCTRHDRVVPGAPVAYMCADAVHVHCVKRTPSRSWLDVVDSGVAHEEPRGIADQSPPGAGVGPPSGAERAPLDGPGVLALPQSQGP